MLARAGPPHPWLGTGEGWPWGEFFLGVVWTGSGGDRKSVALEDFGGSAPNLMGESALPPSPLLLLLLPFSFFTFSCTLGLVHDVCMCSFFFLDLYCVVDLLGVCSVRGWRNFFPSMWPRAMHLGARCMAPCERWRTGTQDPLPVGFLFFWFCPVRHPPLIGDALHRCAGSPVLLHAASAAALGWASALVGAVA